MEKKIDKRIIPLIIIAAAALLAAYTLFLKEKGEDPDKIFASGTI